MQTINGHLHTHFQLEGPSDAPTLVMAHQLAGNLSVWDQQVAALKDQFQILRYDLRGHGQTAVPADGYSLLQLAADALALFDELNLDKVHWVGLSMGGMLGLQLALVAPQRLASLSVCSTVSAIAESAQQMWADRIATATTKGMQALLTPTLARWLSRDFQQNHAEVLLGIEQVIRKTPVRGYCGACQAIRGLNLTAQLGKIRLPTLVMVGDHDPSTSLSDAEAMQASIQGSELAVIAGAQHLANVEQAQVFNQYLGDFLRRQAF